MRIGCLQFAPKVGDVNNNLNRADLVLSRADVGDLDLLVLPELAFTGYNFKSLREISQYLEPSGSGVTSLWARTTALKYDCTVIAGYPEKVDMTDNWPASPEYYNSAIVVNNDGETIANYQKSHLYYTDETWSLEGPSGFYAGRIPGLGRCAMGICMDINPYKFEAPWDEFEFAHHCLNFGAHVIILPMAWLTHENPEEYSRMPQEPDMQTMMYWVSRLEPLVRLESDREIIVIFANRTGMEDEVTYAGTSAVIGIKDGEVLVYGVLGRGDKELLVVDTDEPPFARLVHTTQEPVAPSSAQGSPKQDGSGSSSEGSSRGGDPNHSNGEAGKPQVDTLPDLEHSSAPKHSSARKHDGQASRTGIHHDEGASDLTSELFDQMPSELRSQNQSTLGNMDLLERYLDEQPSRASSSNGYLNSHIPFTHDRKPSVGKTPDSLRARRGSDSGLESRPDVAPVSNRKPTWGQLPPRDDGENDARWNVSDEGDHSDLVGDDGISDGYWNAEVDDSPWGADKRHSLRSDVSVWNNFSGQSKPAEALSTPRSQMISQKVEDYLRGSTPRSESQQDIRRFTEPAPTRGSEARSHHHAPSRGREYRVSESKTTGHRQSALGQHMDKADDVNHTGSARGSTRGPTPGSTGHSGAASSTRMAAESTPQIRESRTRTKATPSRSAKVHTASVIRDGNNIRAASIPINLTRDVPREPSLGRRPPSAPAEDHLPILRPASRSRIQEGGDSIRGRTAEMPLPNSRTHSSGASASIPSETRQLSRGRQRGTRSALDRHQQPHHGPPRTSHSAQNNRRGSVEPVDLSQFHLIEEFPSVNCPVHGSRSRSAARHDTGGGPRRRPSADSHKRPGSRDVRESRRARQNTPAYQMGASAPVATPSKGTGPVPRRKPSKDLKPLRRMTQSVKIDAGEPRRNGGASFGDDIVRTEVTRLDLKHGPKTPVAMVLVGDPDHGHSKLDVVDAPQLNSFGIKGTNMRPERPRSVVW